MKGRLDVSSEGRDIYFSAAFAFLPLCLCVCARATSLNMSEDYFSFLVIQVTPTKSQKKETATPDVTKDQVITIHPDKT